MHILCFDNLSVLFSAADRAENWNFGLEMCIQTDVSHGAFTLFFLFPRYERPWLQSLECGDLPPLPVPHHHNILIQVIVVTQTDSALFFSIHYWLLFCFVFFNLWRWSRFFLFLHFFKVPHIFLPVLFCKYAAAQEKSGAVRHLINSKRLLFFFLHKSVLTLLLVGNNAPFQLFFDSRMIQMPYFHSCAKVVSAFSLLLLR